MKDYKLRVYLDDGRVFTYGVRGESSAREHAAAIIKDGYRHNNNIVFEHYPSWRILKVKIKEGITTNYPDETEGT